jgi:predicted ATPase
VKSLRATILRSAKRSQRRCLLATLVELALGLARVQPTVITTEDLHWADPSTLELIQLLVDQGTSARLLLLYTARPEFRTPWAMRAHHTQVTLNRLGVRDIRTIPPNLAKPFKKPLFRVEDPETRGQPVHTRLAARQCGRG